MEVNIVHLLCRYKYLY